MRIALVTGLAGVLALTALGPGCGGSGGSGFPDGGGGSGSGGSSGGGSGGSGSGSGTLIGGDGGEGDGSFVCDPNPANYDIPGNGCDDDGDGKVDNTILCDQGLPVAGTAANLAAAMDICQSAAGAKWGLVSETFTKGYDGGAANALQSGVLPGFGSVIMPRLGSSLGVLSSGYGRDWDDSAGTGSGSCPVPTGPGVLGAPCFKGYQMAMSGPAQPPPGYPKAAAACPAQTGAGINDSIALVLQIKTPANAKGLQFDFDFYSSEWPEYVCTQFNDGFVAWLQSAAFTGTGTDLNVSYDSKGDPVSVNNAFFDRCTTNASTGCCSHQGSGPEGCGTPTATSACAGGPAEIGGTGFEDDGTFCGGASTGGGATGWLTTTAPVSPGEVITISFIIWDTGDANWDSSVLLDHFTWQPGTTTTGTTRGSQ